MGSWREATEALARREELRSCSKPRDKVRILSSCTWTWAVSCFFSGKHLNGMIVQLREGRHKAAENRTGGQKCSSQSSLMDTPIKYQQECTGNVRAFNQFNTYPKHYRGYWDKIKQTKSLQLSSAFR